MRQIASIVALLTAGAASAQGHGGVDSTGMGQGEAQVSTRSDVRMGIENGPGTTGARLAAMSGAVSASLGDVRQCYARVVAERPNVVGEIRLRVTLPAGRGAAGVEATADTTSDAALARCVTRAIARVSYDGVERPAIVSVTLGFGNTAAAGAVVQAERQAVEAVVDVRTDGDGRFFAEGGTPTGEVRFTVTADGATTRDAIAAMQRSLRAAIAGMLDCRRRSSRHGSNPEGELVIALNVPARGRARVRVTSSTVADARAPTCLGRALGQARFEPGARGAARLVVRWTPQAPMDVPVRPD